MGSVKKAIKIYARVKPSDSSLCKYDIDKHINEDLTTDDILIIRAAGRTAGDENAPASGSVNHPDSYKFRFSKVFDIAATQDMIFEEMCEPVLESALQGYNSTIFAYGQTGSGKTWTMTGSRQQWKNRGIIPRSLSYIFEKFNTFIAQGQIASAFLSYLEIYNENGYDLLHPGFSSGRIEDLKKVQLLEDSQQQIHMKNLTVHPIKSEDEAMQLLYLGDHNRIIAETPMNEASTRSHCIFTIHLNIREGNSSTVRRSKVHLVDLAGSERLVNSNSTGQLFHEARHINLALHYLEQVIVALGEANRSHIPYRNSMMTSILRDSLGGNCMTSMIATISLESRNLMETLSTCRFSQRVALVQNAATLNEETDPMLLIAQLKLENKRLKEIITNSSIRSLEMNNEPLSQEEVGDCWKLVEKFLSDVDEDCILPVAPDMRMVQTCFRCLKMALQMNKDDTTGLTPSVMEKFPVLYHQPPEFVERSTERYTVDMTRDQLVDCLRVRDAEIDVLTKILRPGTLSNKCKGHHYKQNFTTGGSTYEYGDGPQQPCQQSQRLSKKVFSEYDDNQNDQCGYGFQKIIPETKPHARVAQQAIVSSTSDPTRGITENLGSCRDGGGRGEGGLIDEILGSFLTEGFCNAKRQALHIFTGSYSGRETLEKTRDNLESKKCEVDSIETQLRRNHANLSNLKVVLMSSDGGGEEEDTFMREAVGVQSQSIQKQEKQLLKSKEEVRRIEESLKGLYARLLTDFEGYWSNRERSFSSGVKGMPSEVDFSLEASAEKEVTSVGDKPLAEMTKGIVRGVGGACSQQQQSAKFFPQQRSTRNTTSNLMTPSPTVDNSMHFSISSPRASVSVSASSRREKLSTRGKQPPKNSPRRSEKIQPPTPRTPQVPPGTPAAHIRQRQQQHSNPTDQFPFLDSSSYSTRQESHINQRHYFPNYPASNDISINNNIKGQISNLNDDDDADDDDENDDQLMRELPMTGDETIDQEILSFFRTRQAVFKQINNDKTFSTPNGGGGVSGGGGVLSSCDRFS